MSLFLTHEGTTEGPFQVAVDNMDLRIRKWYFLILTPSEGHVLSQRTSASGETVNKFCTIEKIEANMLKIKTVEFPLRNPFTEVQQEVLQDLFFILDAGDRLEKTLDILFSSRLPTHLEEEISQAAGLIKVIKGTVLQMLDGHLYATELNCFRLFQPMTRKINFVVSITKILNYFPL